MKKVMKQVYIKDYEDKCTENGFMFVFKCALCDNKYTSKLRKSSSYRAKKGSKLLGSTSSLVNTLFGEKGHKVAGVMNDGANLWSENSDNAAYEEEKAEALDIAQEEATEYLHKCPECERWVCADCRDEESGLCSECFAKAEEEKKAKEEKKKSGKAGGEADDDGMRVCPGCGEKNPAKMKFCGFCGAKMLTKKICPNCGAENDPKMKFCGECGTKLD
ncbi:MAG: zinc-ribbon domain-containing protein [Clostridia bacterium]|nr:zinc-ribbon domain-containing protein [Clostridia bacterium]